MSNITAEHYRSFSDEDKLGLLQLMYHNLKGEPNKVKERELIIEETERVVFRLQTRKQ
jgi:hypothetical protein